MIIRLLSLFMILNLIVPAYPCNRNCMQLTEEALSQSAYQLSNLYNQISLIPDRLPYTINEKGKLVTINVKNWTSGFFPGSLWYLYEYSGKEEMKKAALEMTERIREQEHMTTNHDIGFMIFCSFGNALRLTGNKEFEKVIVTAARSLSTRFSKQLGVIKSWDNDNWQYPVIIDNMMNLKYAMMYRETHKKEYLEHAIKIANYITI